MAGLTNKQRMFVEAYVQTWNATAAARAAGYSEKTARSIGSENLTKPDVAEAIKARIAEKAMTADEVLIRLGEQARGTMDDFLTDLGTNVRLDVKKGLKSGKGHLIKKFSMTHQGTTIELYDAQAALVHLGKHHGLFLERHEYSGSIDVNDARERLAHKLDSIARTTPADGVSGEPDQ